MLLRSFKKYWLFIALALVSLGESCRPSYNRRADIHTAVITAVKIAPSSNRPIVSDGQKLDQSDNSSSDQSWKPEPLPLTSTTPITINHLILPEETLDRALENEYPEEGGTKEKSNSVPLINSFWSNRDRAFPGDVVRLEWVTEDSAEVTLWRLAPTGQFSHFWSVASSGFMDYQVDIRERNWVNFAITAEGNDGKNETASLTIILNCTAEWFFEDSPDVCPLDPPLLSAGAEQHFQGGTLIWVKDEERIYALFDDGRTPRWNVYDDAWDEESIGNDPELAAPPGHYAPVRGFGYLWNQQPDVRERLGWAIDEEVGFMTMVQRTSYAKYNETFIRALGGSIWHLLPEKSDWVKE